MERCLICSKTGSGPFTALALNIRKCKVCGMSVNKFTGLKRKGFFFCSRQCKRYFQRILEKSNYKDYPALINKDVLV